MTRYRLRNASELDAAIICGCYACHFKSVEELGNSPCKQCGSGIIHARTRADAERLVKDNETLIREIEILHDTFGSPYSQGTR